ncbi:MAG: hypothetical protein R3E91_04905 [Chlamydiales bacterium]
MEKISEIRKAIFIRKIQKKEEIAVSRSVDLLSISSDSEKKRIWVEKLKAMAEIRPEKVKIASKTPPSDYELAKRILDHQY